MNKKLIVLSVLSALALPARAEWAENLAARPMAAFGEAVRPARAVVPVQVGEVNEEGKEELLEQLAPKPVKAPAPELPRGETNIDPGILNIYYLNGYRISASELPPQVTPRKRRSGALPVFVKSMLVAPWLLPIVGAGYGAVKGAEAMEGNLKDAYLGVVADVVGGIGGFIGGLVGGLLFAIIAPVLGLVRTVVEMCRGNWVGDWDET